MPLPGSESISRVAPAAAVRSLQQPQPECPSAAPSAPARRAGLARRPRRPARCSPQTRSRAPRRGFGSACFAGVPDRLLRDPEHQCLPLAFRGRVPPVPRGAFRSLGGRAGTGDRPAPASGPPPATAAGRSRPGGCEAPARSPEPARHRGEGRRCASESVRSAAAASEKESAARSWTIPSCTSPAIRRRSAVEESTARCNRASRSALPRRIRRAIEEASGSCTSSSTTSARTSAGAKASQRSRPLEATDPKLW